jgi:hypothetical protein
MRQLFWTVAKSGSDIYWKIREKDFPQKRLRTRFLSNKKSRRLKLEQISGLYVCLCVCLFLGPFSLSLLHSFLLTYMPYLPRYVCTHLLLLWGFCWLSAGPNFFSSSHVRNHCTKLVISMVHRGFRREAILCLYNLLTWPAAPSPSFVDHILRAAQIHYTTCIPTYKLPMSITQSQSQVFICWLEKRPQELCSFA